MTWHGAALRQELVPVRHLGGLARPDRSAGSRMEHWRGAQLIDMQFLKEEP
jgi:hypothetical protein